MRCDRWLIQDGRSARCRRKFVILNFKLWPDLSLSFPFLLSPFYFFSTEHRQSNRATNDRAQLFSSSFIFIIRRQANDADSSRNKRKGSSNHHTQSNTNPFQIIQRISTENNVVIGCIVSCTSFHHEQVEWCSRSLGFESDEWKPYAQCVSWVVDPSISHWLIEEFWTHLTNTFSFFNRLTGFNGEKVQRIPKLISRLSSCQINLTM